MDPEKDTITLELYRCRYDPYKAEIPAVCPNCGGSLRSSLTIEDLRLGEKWVLVDGDGPEYGGGSMGTDEAGRDVAVRCGDCDHRLVEADVNPVEYPEAKDPQGWGRCRHGVAMQFECDHCDTDLEGQVTRLIAEKAELQRRFDEVQDELDAHRHWYPMDGEPLRGYGVLRTDAPEPVLVAWFRRQSKAIEYIEDTSQCEYSDDRMVVCVEAEPWRFWNEMGSLPPGWRVAHEGQAAPDPSTAAQAVPRNEDGSE